MPAPALFLVVGLIMIAVFWKETKETIKKSAIRHRKLICAVAIIVGAAVYLNVGWAVGTYYHTYIFDHEPQTFWQTVWKGGYQYLTGNDASTLLTDQILLMFIWPVMVGILVPISWAIYAIHHFVVLVFYFIMFILRLVFAGGIAKLLGVG